MSCIFCEIVAGKEPAHVVFEDDDCIAFLSIGRASDGHTLIVPRVHATDIWDIEPETWAAVARTTQIVCRLLDERLNPDGMTLVQTNRVAGWQSVFHLHVHAVPRYDDDTLVAPWPEVIQPRAALDRVGDLLGVRRQM